MGILIFIIVLVVLIVVHELGHFFVAKWCGMRVEEFGIGYPPKALTYAVRKGTAYTLNWVPFGGFVKIYGEDGDGEVAPDSFSAKPKWAQAIVLVAGVAMNLILAWVLYSSVLMIGAPQALSDADAAHTPGAQLVVAGVGAGVPAEAAGLMAGDVIEKASRGDATFSAPSAAGFSDFINGSKTPAPITFTILRGTKEETIIVTPKAGLIESDPSRLAVGLQVTAESSKPLGFFQSLIEGTQITWNATAATAVALVHFFAGVFTLSANLSEVAGPLGIAGAIGTASAQGVVALFSLVAIISINLALVNLIPLPALDGGRLLFVIIEAVSGKRIPASVAGAINTAGFALLILLMVVVSIHDVSALFSHA